MGRGKSEKVEEVKSGLRWAASLLPMATVKSGSELLLGSACGFGALMQLLMTPDTTKDEEDGALQNWLHPSLAAT